MTFIPAQGLTLLHCWKRGTGKKVARDTHVIVGYAMHARDWGIVVDPISVTGRVVNASQSRWSATYEHHLAGRITYTDANGELIDIAFAETKAAEHFGCERP